ncbi:MAG: SIR2 family NAD-dependent protein deacylase [Burkholderiaceae bacterium]
MSAPFETARQALAGARRLAVLTGAGISAESGIPTFRDAQTGLWARYDPMQLATEEGFRADPSLVWGWYAWRRELVRDARPNAGHRALAAAEARFAHVRVITQNVDGLHARAGSSGLLELHGNILTTICLERCGFREDVPERLPVGAPPRCPRCGAWLRPGVVWFGEMLDPRSLRDAAAEAADCDVMLVVGTSGLVHPAAGLPAEARRAGAAVITVNPEATELDSLATACIRGRAAEVLPALLADGGAT